MKHSLAVYRVRRG